MKKLLSVILTIAIVLGLCACSGSGEAKAKGLHAGYARQSIMPDEPVGLAGYGNEDVRKSSGYLDYIYLSCVAFADGEDTVLMITVDNGGIGTSHTDSMRKDVSDATGVPVTNITISSSHSHSAPIVSKNYEAYRLQLHTAAVTAAKDALADLSPATMYATNVQVEGLNFTRHYIQADGSYSSANLGNFKNEPGVKHAREADHEMVLLRVERAAEDKNDILMMNWAAHPCFDSSSDNTLLHPDYIGAIRNAVEQETGMHFAFIQGGVGDTITDSGIPEQKHGLDRVAYGEALAKHVVDALPTMEKVEGDGIKTTVYNFEYACNHYGEDMLEDAKKVMEFYSVDRAKAKALADSLGFYSINHAKGVVRVASNPESMTAEIGALYIAGVGIAYVPAEMFSETSMYVKDSSPFKYTMFCSLTNGSYSYIPISAAYDYPSYEGFVANFGKGSAEAIADQMVTMLKGFQ